MIDSRELLETYLDYSRIGSFVLREWENCIDSTIKNMILNTSFYCMNENLKDEAKTNEKYKVSFRNYEVRGSANFPTNENSLTECRRKQDTYIASIYVDIYFTDEQGVEHHYENKKHKLFSFPLMVGSKYCELYDKSPSEVILMKECPIDSYGYYLINGKEKFANLKRRVRTGKYIISDDTSKTVKKENRLATEKFKIQSPQLSIVCSMTCNKFSGTSKITIRKKSFDSKIICVDLPVYLRDELTKDIFDVRKASLIHANIFLIIDVLLCSAAKKHRKLIEEKVTKHIDKASKEYLNLMIKKVFKKNQEIVLKQAKFFNIDEVVTTPPSEYMKGVLRRNATRRKLMNQNIGQSVGGERIPDTELLSKHEENLSIEMEEEIIPYRKTKEYIDFANKIKEEASQKIYNNFDNLNYSDKSKVIIKIISDLNIISPLLKDSYELYINATSRDYIESYIESGGDIYATIKKINSALTIYEDEILFAKIVDQFFPPPMVEYDNNESRVYSLVCMMINLLQYFVGEKNLDDKNSFTCTQIDGGGRNLYGLIVGPYWRECMDKYFKTIPTIKQFLRDMMSLSGIIVTRFVTGKWKVSQDKNDSILISEDLRRESSNSSFFSITKIIAPSSDEGVQTEVRFQNGSHNRRICSFHTPDSGKTGLVTYAATSVQISQDRDAKVLLNQINQLFRKENIQWFKHDRSDLFSYRLFCNSIFRGWVNCTDQIYSIIKSIKFTQQYFDISIYKVDKFKTIEIFCDYGRLVTPLLVVKNGKALVESLPIEQRTIISMLEKGVIEFLDANEEESYVVSPEPEMLSELSVTFNQYKEMIKEKDKIYDEMLLFSSLSNRDKKQICIMNEQMQTIEYISSIVKEASLLFNNKNMLEKRKKVLNNLFDIDILAQTIGNLISMSKSFKKETTSLYKLIKKIEYFANGNKEDGEIYVDINTHKELYKDERIYNNVDTDTDINTDRNTHKEVYGNTDIDTDTDTDTNENQSKKLWDSFNNDLKDENSSLDMLALNLHIAIEKTYFSKEHILTLFEDIYSFCVNLSVKSEFIMETSSKLRNRISMMKDMHRQIEIIRTAEDRDKLLRKKDELKKLTEGSTEIKENLNKNIEYEKVYNSLKKRHSELSKKIMLFDRYKYYKSYDYVTTSPDTTQDNNLANENYINEVASEKTIDCEYTHSELNPNFIFGISQNLIPFANHNPATRSFYQCGQNVQLSSLLALNEAYRFDTSCNKLLTASPPSITTEIGRAMRIDQFPQHIEICIAFVAYGDNQEDGVIFKKSAIDRGLFYTANMKTITIEYKTSDTVGYPIVQDKEKHLYSNLNKKTGIIKEGTYVNTGDIIVCFVDPNTGRKVGVRKARVDDVGFVERVESSSLGKNFIIIKLRKINIPDFGDKFSQSPAQKATSNNIYNEEDMPFAEDGTIPDIIVSPNSVMGRTTIGAFLQPILGNYTALTGSTADATMFKDFNYDLIAAELIRHNMSYSGKKTFMSGTDGNLIVCDIFVGMSPYSALKHQVQKKIQYRSEGARDAVTRQPKGGRDGGTKASAQKIGEYEFSAFESHGASEMVRDVNYRSNIISVDICRNCGFNAISQEDKGTIRFICRICDKSNCYNIVTKKMPFSAVMLETILMAFGIKTSRMFENSTQRVERDKVKRVKQEEEETEDELVLINLKSTFKTIKECYKEIGKLSTSRRVLYSIIKKSLNSEDEIKLQYIIDKMSHLLEIRNKVIWKIDKITQIK